MMPSMEVERLREKASHDEAQALYNAEQKGVAKGIAKGRAEGASERNIEIARNLLAMGMQLDQVAKATGLSREEIEDLR